jgi:hypothetical protein
LECIPGHRTRRGFPDGSARGCPDGDIPEHVAEPFNEGKVCDAIVHHLEKRANASRTGLRWPEDERHPFPGEIVFTIGSHLFALEHTGIEPFKGHVQMEAEASRHFAPIVDALKGALSTTAVFELIMPINAFQGKKMSEVRSIQQAIVDWVKITALRRCAAWRASPGEGRKQSFPAFRRAAPPKTSRRLD